jgi:hypothetical protein
MLLRLLPYQLASHFETKKGIIKVVLFFHLIFYDLWLSKRFGPVTSSEIFNNSLMLNIKFGAGAAACYGSGSTKIMRLLAVPAPAPERS